MKRAYQVRRWWFVLIFLIGLTSPHAFAAEVKKVIGKKGDPDLILIKGKIIRGDEKVFKDIALNTESAIVVFNSPGGLLRPALEIGKTIRIKGFSTAVLDSDCTSACAIAWLAGQPRMLSKKSGVGFHAIYIEDESGKKIPTGVGNALVGSYLSNLGLNDSVVAYVSEASPDEIKWLTKEHADKIGLPVSILSNKNGARARANHNLAIQSRWGKKPSIKNTLKYYRLSADDGFAGAQNNLGDLYETGEGVPKNDKFAAYWYARSAERGEPTAYFSLSTLLSDNTKDEAVLIEALKFAMLAVANLPEGYNKSQAIKTANKISSQLSPEAKAYANDLAIEWEPLYQETYLMSDSPAAKK
jgi:hypothetical protein